ncbi:glycosyltransferase family 2 protein [Solilutibacter silvestris]|uniref:Glycosyl transferase family 2 n=1 Tax=Solilutibacter silvestris TaxID=1645665 RepID=A0A2K1Q0E4_9GAMM|nr:glycosyltransferase family 2 protein [Lysobacter silvestris]PNS08512.1 Glycosyl transferase family 2 [Lysobacter silvestris]
MNEAAGAKPPVTGVVIAKNEGDRIGRCVASLVPLCREVIVMDSQSDDDTVAAAAAAGARVVQQPWLGFAAQKNAVIALATTPWVLLLDSDEWLAAGTADAIRTVFADDHVERADVWKLLRRTHYLGTALDHGGWGKEKVERLFRNDLRYKPASVHEALDTAGKRVATLQARIEHDTARSDDEYASKLQRYATLWAQQRHAQGRRASAIDAPLHAGTYWLKNYVLRGGFLDGGTSARYHALHARYVFDKYRKLRGLAR